MKLYFFVITFHRIIKFLMVFDWRLLMKSALDDGKVILMEKININLFI